ncbi:hypothetical protein Ancab_010811 [Ancistrocladus abbreviatus]
MKITTVFSPYRCHLQQKMWIGGEVQGTFHIQDNLRGQRQAEVIRGHEWILIRGYLLEIVEITVTKTKGMISRELKMKAGLGKVRVSKSSLEEGIQASLQLRFGPT